MDTAKQNAHFQVGAATYANTPKFYPKKRAKAVIVWLAMRGLIPADFATWLLQRGGLRHE